MSTRRVDVKRIATNKPESFLDVSVSYFDDWRDGQHVRGYRLNVGVIEDHNDGFIKYLIGQGGWGFLEHATRFNARRLQQLADAAMFPGNEALERIVAMVLRRTGLMLAGEPEPVVAEAACAVEA